MSEEGSSSTPPQHDIDDDYHRPLSPPTPAESLFLPNVQTHRISAAALASSIHSVHSARSRTGASTIVTDEFASAAGDLSEAEAELDEEEEDLYQVQITRNSSSSNHTSSTSLFGRDILFLSRPIEEEPRQTNNSKMSYKSKSKTKPVIVDKSGDPYAKTVDEEPHFDVGTNVYEAAKGVWGWGKSLPVAGSILGLYEAAGAKVVSTAVHKDLSTVDAELKHHVSGLDKDVIDPAIAAVLAIIFPAIEKGEEVLKPIVMKIPILNMVFCKLLTNEADEPEKTPASLEVN